MPKFVESTPFCVYCGISFTPGQTFYTYVIGSVGEKYEVCQPHVFFKNIEYFGSFRHLRFLCMFHMIHGHVGFGILE